jgi:hypothetical protein
MKTREFAIVALAVTAVFVPLASGGAPMGPPTAFLGEGQWAVGGEYGREQISMGSSGRVDERFLNGTSFFWTQPFKIEDLTSNMYFGTLGYGIGDNWDIFARIGASDAKDRIVIPPSDTQAAQRQDDFNGGVGLAWGAGTRATFCRSGPWSFGGLMQVTWFRPGQSHFAVVDHLIPDESWVGDAKLDYWQAQVSLAAAYQMDKLRFWGGPFLQFIRGNLDFSGNAVLNQGGGVSTIRWTTDLEESSQIGGHVGVNWELCNQFDLWVEGQITTDSWLVSVGGVFIPQKTFGL